MKICIFFKAKDIPSYTNHGCPNKLPAIMNISQGIFPPPPLPPIKWNPFYGESNLLDDLDFAESKLAIRNRTKMKKRSSISQEHLSTKGSSRGQVTNQSLKEYTWICEAAAETRSHQEIKLVSLPFQLQRIIQGKVIRIGDNVSKKHIKKKLLKGN